MRESFSHGDQAKFPGSRSSLITPRSSRQEIDLHDAIGLSCDHNHICLGVERKARDPEIKRYRLISGLDTP